MTTILIFIKITLISYQNFLICIEMFIAAVAHIYSFPHHPFHINSPQYWNNPNHSWCRAFLSMMDISDMQEDVTEHLGVVGSTLSRRFQGRSTYQPLARSPRRSSSESEYLIGKRQDQQHQQQQSGNSSQSGNMYGATSSRLIVPVYEGKLSTLPENHHPSHTQSRFPQAGIADDSNSSNSNHYQQQQLHATGSQPSTRQRDTLHLRERERETGAGGNFLRLAPGATAAAPIPESNDDYALLLGTGAGR